VEHASRPISPPTSGPCLIPRSEPTVSGTSSGVCSPCRCHLRRMLSACPSSFQAESLPAAACVEMAWHISSGAGARSSSLVGHRRGKQRRCQLIFFFLQSNPSRVSRRQERWGIDSLHHPFPSSGYQALQDSRVLQRTLEFRAVERVGQAPTKQERS